MRRDSFEHFYLTKVALGDCCGCAERVIDWRDIELAKARRPVRRPLMRWVLRLLGRAGKVRRASAGGR